MYGIQYLFEWFWSNSQKKGHEIFLNAAKIVLLADLPLASKILTNIYHMYNFYFLFIYLFDNFPQGRWKNNRTHSPSQGSPTQPN